MHTIFKTRIFRTFSANDWNISESNYSLSLNSHPVYFPLKTASTFFSNAEKLRKTEHRKINES